MKNMFTIAIIFSSLFFHNGFVYADNYEVVMCEEKELCADVQRLLNRHLTLNINELENKYSGLSGVKFDPLPNKHVNANYHDNLECFFHERVNFDINNDGKLEQLIRESGCLSGTISQSIYIYSASDLDSNHFREYSKLTPLASLALTGSFYELKKLPKIRLKGQFSDREVSQTIGGFFRLNQ